MNSSLHELLYKIHSLIKIITVIIDQKEDIQKVYYVFIKNSMNLFEEKIVEKRQYLKEMPNSTIGY